jgi:putative ABC transport system permease protein
MGKLYIFYRAFIAAYRSITSVKWKASIAILTILIGALAITTTFSISSNVDVYVDYLIEQNGGPKVSIQNYSHKDKFELNDLKKFENISVIKKAYITGSKQINLRNNDVSSNIKVFAVTKDNWDQISYTVLSGHLISPGFIGRASNVIVLSKEGAKRLGSGSGVGNYVNVKMPGAGEIRLKIIGIVELNSAQYDQGSAFVDLQMYQNITGEKTLGDIQLIATDPKWMNWIENFANNTLGSKYKDNFFVNNPLVYFLETKKQLEVFIQMGYILGFMALIAGAVGSTSVMILNINLRRKEIGLYKSMGFSPFVILVQFTFETLIQSLFGGFMGGFFGSIIGYYISMYIFNIAQLNVLGFFLGLSSATLAGLVFGLIPAFMAARVDPVKALQ